MALTTPSVSPAIVVKEIDLTGIAPNVETSLSGFVGDFNWGPVDEPTRIINEAQLAEVFGTPNANNAVDYFSAAQYLRYSGNLILNRQVTTSEDVVINRAANATSGSGQLFIGNDQEFETSTTEEMFIAKYPGALGNSLKVSMFAMGSGESAESPSHITKFENWNYSNFFDGRTKTSVWAEELPGSVRNDEVHVAVIDEGGKISGSAGTVLEVFPFVSVALGAKTVDNGNNYIASVINNGSRYIRFGEYDSDNMIHGTGVWGTTPSLNTDYATKCYLQWRFE